MTIQFPRKRPSDSNGFQVKIQWLVYLFFLTNLLFIFYVYNVASSCSLDKVVAVPKLTQQSKPEGSDNFLQWLIENPNTPGARLVNLLRQHLHTYPNAEGERLQACHDKNYPLCFAGQAAFHKAVDEAPADKKDDLIYLERSTRMPLTSGNVDVWKMRRFAKMSDGKFRVINNLGTEPACLALSMAGAAVGDFGVVVELGTYLGLSSKCISLGLNSTNREGAYFAFDLFGNDSFNYEKITRSMPWTIQVKPDFKKESSYLWLWKSATIDVYPTAQAFEGSIDSTTLYPKLWKKKPIALLSVDSAKTWAAFRDQTAGIQRPYMLKKGAILILMDFLTIDTQIKLLYTGCLGQFLQPVYSSYCKGEQWIFVAKQSFSLGMIGACMQDYLGDQPEPSQDQYETMIEEAQRHTDFMSSLGIGSPSMQDERQCMMDHLTKELKESTIHWKYLRVQ